MEAGSTRVKAHTACRDERTVPLVTVHGPLERRGTGSSRHGATGPWKSHAASHAPVSRPSQLFLGTNAMGPVRRAEW